MEDGCQQRLGQHFNNHCSWIPRDNAVPGSCQLLRGHADHDQWEVQTASDLTTTLHISLAFYYISVYEEKRQTVDATIFPLNASWHYSCNPAKDARTESPSSLRPPENPSQELCTQILPIHILPEKVYRQSRITTLPSICWDASKSLPFPEGIKTGALSLQSSLS